MTQEGANAPSIDFYFDFASPYAWLATGQLKKLAAEFGLRLVWRPILLWVVLRQQQIPPPLESPKRKAYMLHDMERSARFYSVDYRLPKTFPVNSSIAAKAYYAIERTQPELAAVLAEDFLSAHFVRDVDISDKSALATIASSHGIAPGMLESSIEDSNVRARLRQANEDAIRIGVIGSPFVVAGNEAFFGADRMAHVAWHLRALSLNAAGG